eukprot:CAMPEP_0202383348 /NCGR_PEP_ID=MMETSP1127-20130417/48693_1 /ASSEMBLY_ACC=CAM_ASM_000462 /TAXON_ID=3047 /ORGANISM="Dunaliella tertiolecta, Strain CCMP1320" /LENGTH=32 /DNA_ID= /DNA_START= /DNA_END= /DNA_ORIENTATION=
MDACTAAGRLACMAKGGEDQEHTASMCFSAQA